ncbi:uronyl 2-sulfotransferase homolog pip-like [Oratosquilla oratoria]|uniref:uronyl 2-sulfotransferase homolog pip-like n=1 Tax=Oratosquilla oratoria TaxID=337810 RepID=UPI003F7739B8
MTLRSGADVLQTALREMSIRTKYRYLLAALAWVLVCACLLMVNSRNSKNVLQLSSFQGYAQEERHEDGSQANDNGEQEVETWPEEEEEQQREETLPLSSTWKEEFDGSTSPSYDEVVVAAMNVTPHASKLLIYNRIPKCASSTVQTVLRWLARQLDYQHVSSNVFDERQLSQKEQLHLANSLLSGSQHISYDRHLYYTNFSALELPPPIYVNVVRDPIERFISSFYYRRSEERLNRLAARGRTSSPPSAAWINRTVEQCVTSDDEECLIQEGDQREMMLTYFCGHQSFCREIGNQDALAKAKQVVSQAYSVVGLVADMDTSFALMETLIPRFMTNATRAYGKLKKHEQAVNKNRSKPVVSKEIKDILRDRMSQDIEFYQFLKQRLYRQADIFLANK